MSNDDVVLGTIIAIFTDDIFHGVFHNTKRLLRDLRSCIDEKNYGNIYDERTHVKVRIHGAILRAILLEMAELYLVSTPKFVARNIAHNIAAVESRPTSATLRATNFFVYPPSAAFRAIV